jgi:BMFP domain-containing protein YqiC
MLSRHTHARLVRAPLSSFALLVLLCAAASAQQQPVVEIPPPPAPPPMKYIPASTRAQLDAARDMKERTKLSLAAAEARLAAAEARNAAQQYDPAAAELGVYQAIAADALLYLQRTGRNDGKARDLYKLLEQTLYKHLARLEAIRRETPPEFVGNIRAALNQTRDTRTDALNAFYGNTVVREQSSDKNKPKTP